MITILALDLATGETFEDAVSRLYTDDQIFLAREYIAQLRAKRRKGSTIIHGIRRNHPAVNAQ